jgi:hypothetical protein
MMMVTTTHQESVLGLAGGSTSVTVDIAGSAPRVLHWGPRLEGGEGHGTDGSFPGGG